MRVSASGNGIYGGEDTRCKSESLGILGYDKVEILRLQFCQAKSPIRSNAVNLISRV